VSEASRAALTALSAALAARDGEALEAALDDAAAATDPRAVEESILQSYLFLGYPAALDALARWRRRAPSPAGEPEPADWEAWRRRGERVCARVYGGQYERLRRNVAALHPELERWMVTEGYGKVLGRPGLELAERELCIVAMLAVLGAERQLYSHLRGALNAGADPGAVDAARDAAALRAPGERAERARRVWADLRDRQRGGAG
jgi:4-carboxymuconolactone decarboxylase